MKIFLMLALLWPAVSHAYLPPAFFIYSKLTEQKTKNAINGAALTVARPQASGTEEILGTITITDWKGAPNTWPTLSLIFDTDAEALIKSVVAFGIPVLREQDLLRVEKERLGAMKEPPHPFYRIDPNMSLKRARQTYAWVHSPKGNLEKSIWVEKESFLPLKVAAPCPPAVASLGWAKVGENKCEVEFRNLAALKRGNFQSARLTLWKDGAPLLFFTFDKLASGRSPLPKADDKLSPEVKEIVETILH